MSDTNNGMVYLLAIRGSLAPATLAAARTVHNQTAGAPANVAAAQSLGDLSHMVYVPTEKAQNGAGEFLILDLWNRLDGLNQFFANPQVQEQAAVIFARRDPVVWAPANGFVSFHFPAPHGRNDRIIGVVRGKAKSQAEAQAIHNELIAGQVNKARKAGLLTHDAYFRLAAPGSAEALEFLAVDVWTNAAGMNEYYETPGFMSSLEKLFAAAPDASTWLHPEGDWVEW